MQSEEKKVKINKLERAYTDWMLKEVIKIVFAYITKDGTRFS